MTVASGSISPARVCAYRVLRRVFEQDAYADRALEAEAQAAGLDQRDRALAMRLAYGAVQRRATLDHVAERLAGRPPGKLDAPVLAALRLGLFQLLFLDGVAPHAAVNESVELARSDGSFGGGLVNAVLRRAAREGRVLLGELGEDTPEQAAKLHSVPGWLASRWWDELGPAETRALLLRINEPAESALRANTLVATADEVSARLAIPARPAPAIPEGLVLDGPFDVRSSGLWAEGAIMGQSRASMLVARVLDPHAGDRVLDLCSAPGGKSTHIAALMRNDGEVVAVERNAGRAVALAETCTRMRATCVRVEHADATEPRGEGGFQRVLVDPPCSGLGTLQSRPDLRWRASPARIVELARLQAQILGAAASATAPGGVLVYSVCTISREEGQDMIDRFVRDHGQFSVEQLIQTLPHRDHTDGFFIAKLRRAAG
jgi:16S rRNA (cytosine967-C5)-methyltransferase